MEKGGKHTQIAEGKKQKNQILRSEAYLGAPRLQLWHKIMLQKKWLRILISHHEQAQDARFGCFGEAKWGKESQMSHTKDTSTH